MSLVITLDLLYWYCVELELGMMRYDARLEMESALREKGLFRGKEDNKMRLGLCSRSSDIIEPMLTPQW